MGTYYHYVFSHEPDFRAFFFSSIGKTLGESESVSFLLCEFFEPRAEDKDTVSRISEKAPLLLFCFVFSLFLISFIYFFTVEGAA